MSNQAPALERRTVTAQEAKDWLHLNKVNRAVRSNKVDQYTRDMENGRWNLCTSPIVFGDDGNLIDGQHRLSAQVRAGIDVEWIIVREAPEGTQNTIDSGASRSASDTLHMHGMENSQLLAAIARMVRKIETDTITGGGTFSPQEILETVQEHPELGRSTQMAQDSKSGMTPIAPSVLGTAHWMIAQKNGGSVADKFVMRIARLVGEPEGSPILALKKRADEIKRNAQTIRHRDMLALVIKCWNYLAEGKTAVKLNLYSKTGVYELPEVLVMENSMDRDYDEDDD